MDNYISEKHTELYNNYICPYCHSQKKNPIINLSNDVYDQNFVSLINSLNLHIKNFYQKMRGILDDVKNNYSSLGSQINHSKFLIKGIMVKDSNFLERYRQLCDRIDIINGVLKDFDPPLISEVKREILGLKLDNSNSLNIKIK